MLSREGCAGRLERIREWMQKNGCGAFLAVDSRNVYYLEGVLVPRGHPVLLWIEAENTQWLVTDSKTVPAQSEIIEFESYSPRRVIDLLWRDAAALAASRWRGGTAKKIAIEKDAANVTVLDALVRCFPHSELYDASSDLADLRRARDPDEVDVLRRIANVTDAGFARAREVVRGDFACGPRSLKQGGVPIDRRLESGDLCVFDLSPMGWGYQADLCRTIAVGEPSAVQLQGYELVCEALRIAESHLQPGHSASAVYQAVRYFLDQHSLSAGTFWHHLGHGIGMGGHENPRFVPESDQVVRVGDVISIEPGIYNPKLQGGLRIENTYWLAPHGLVQLNSHPTYLMAS
jgi:Xaa-Pro dipeptidase